ncbi:PIG-L family deacetylase [Alphaproteobacteria bacterium]|nr:PIG-L family deacetylase [Alphaproteobacteria bacterium]
MSTLRILVIAAHPDDEVLGMGGSLLRHKSNGDIISVMFMSDGVSGRDPIYDPNKRAKEIQERKAMAYEAGALFGTEDLTFLDLPNLRMDREYLLDLTKRIESKIDSFLPDIVYTHCSSDTNVDHCITHKACVVALRPIPSRKVSSLRLFEISSSTEYSVMSSGNDFIPNLYIDISDFKENKLELIRCYEYEMREFPHPRSEKAIVARDVFRGTSVGIECAESFLEVRRIIF